MKRIQFVIAVILLMSCSSSKITSSWKAPDAVPGTYGKILVLGMIADKDRAIQEQMEAHFAGDLKNLGYNAVTSLQVFGPKAFDGMTEAEAVQSLKASGIEAIITIVLLDKQKEMKYVPGQIHYSPYSYYYNHFWGYRTAMYNRISEPGYYVTDTYYFWESNVYDMKTQSLVYSVQTKSFDPMSTEAMAHEYGKMIVQKMVKENILVKAIKSGLASL